ncbi:MAG: right-handed parallel beta-helix repeat-containing protein [Armatimonadetes bacterium]|nr:right-handed parallel beta-helix repeat-containing protein [Armatimonadota bacterium]
MGRLTQPVIVRLRAGRYFLENTLTLGPEDSGTEECPITYCAYPGEKVEIVGGRLITELRPGKDGVLRAKLPEVAAGKWYFRSLFVDGRREIRARQPNFDPSDPYRKGFFYAARDPQGFGYAVGNIHNRGDWLEYEVEVPADGEYFLWVYYGALNAPFGRTSMDGRTAISVNGGEFVRLTGLPDTGGWSTFRWSRCATLRLSRGKCVLHWENLEGGGINLEAWVLTDDPHWEPQETTIPQPQPGKHVLLIQAEDFRRSHGPQISVTGSGKGSLDSFTYSPDDLDPRWANAPDAEIHIFQSGSCRAFLEIVKLVSIDPKTRKVSVGGPECVAELNVGDRYWVENVPQLLDSPREWYLDRSTGVLEYVPAPDFGPRSQVIAPTVGRMIELLGDKDSGQAVSNVRFVGLTFSCNDYSPQDGCVGYGMGTEGTLHFVNASNCWVRDCTFVNIGKYAVCLVGGSQNVVAGNDISHSAEGGILLIDSRENRVVDNHIHHCGEVYKHVGGVVMTGSQCSENHVARNVIHDMSRYGITFKNAGLRNVVEFNFVQNTNLETYDTGGIEVTQHDRELRSGSLIRGNIVTDTVGYSSVGEKPVFLSWGIYLDSFAGGYTVTENLVCRNYNGGIMLQGGKGNVVTNNIFVEGWAFQGYIANFQNNFADVVLERNVFAWSSPGASVFGHGSIAPDVIRIDRNLYWPGGARDPVFGWGGKESWEAWRSLGFDEHSLVADPRFRDPTHDDYTLLPDSPAFTLGFKPLDLEPALQAKRRCRCKIEPAAPIFFASSS